MRNKISLLLCCLTFIVAGCCCPPPPPQRHIGHHAAPYHYAEPHWPYYDQNGTPRIMGDTHLRHHLGVIPPNPAPSEELVR